MNEKEIEEFKKMREALDQVVNNGAFDNCLENVVIPLHVFDACRRVLGLENVNVEEERQKITAHTRLEARKLVIDDLKKGRKLAAVRLWRELTYDDIRTSRDVVNKIQEEEGIVIEGEDPGTV